MRRLLFLITMSGLLLLATVILAAGDGPRSITRWVIGSGGGQVVGGDCTLASTIGQPVAGVVVAGNYRLTSGFWSGPPAAAVARLYLPLLMRGAS